MQLAPMLCVCVCVCVEGRLHSVYDIIGGHVPFI